MMRTLAAFLPQNVALGALAALVAVLLSLPTVIVVATSFTAAEIVTFPPHGFSLRWYGALAQQPEIVSAFGRSLIVAGLATAIMAPCGTLAALGLRGLSRRMKVTFDLYFLLPFTIPVVVAGIALMTLFGELRLLGGLGPVAVAIAATNLPFMIGAVTASLSGLDPDVEDAAAICGAPPVQVFLTVTIPAVMPGIITGALLSFIIAFNEFVVSLFFVDKRIETLPVAIYGSIRSIVTPDIAAVSVVYVALAAAAILIVDRVVGLELFLKSR
jgi:putative spermidine/putrescine transport system permease protein